jgi:hypothetical protein
VELCGTWRPMHHMCYPVRAASRTASGQSRATVRLTTSPSRVFAGLQCDRETPIRPFLESQGLAGSLDFIDRGECPQRIEGDLSITVGFCWFHARPWRKRKSPAVQPKTVPYRMERYPASVGSGIFRCRPGCRPGGRGWLVPQWVPIARRSGRNPNS